MGDQQIRWNDEVRALPVLEFQLDAPGITTEIDTVSLGDFDEGFLDAINRLRSRFLAMKRHHGFAQRCNDDLIHTATLRTE